MSKCTLGNAIQYHFVAVLADPFSNLLITHFVYVRRLRSSANYYTTTEVLVDTDNSDSWVIARSDVPEYSSRVKTVFKHIFDFLSDQSSCVKKKNFLQPIMICWNAHTSPWRWSWLSGKHCNNFIIICFVASGLSFYWFWSTRTSVAKMMVTIRFALMNWTRPVLLLLCSRQSSFPQPLLQSKLSIKMIMIGNL